MRWLVLVLRGVARLLKRTGTAPLGSSSTIGAVAFERIAVDPDRLAGAPCIRDLRFPAATVVAMVPDGVTNDEILAEHPDLDAEDIAQSLRYAALAVQEWELPVRSPT